MAQKPNGIPIELDKVRHLKFTLNSLASLEDEFGASLQSIFAAPEKLGYREMRSIIWAALIHEDAELTVEKAGELTDYIPDEVADNFHAKNEYLLQKIGEAFGAQVESKKKSLPAKAGK